MRTSIQEIRTRGSKRKCGCIHPPVRARGWPLGQFLERLQARIVDADPIEHDDPCWQRPLVHGIVLARTKLVRIRHWTRGRNGLHRKQQEDDVEVDIRKHRGDIVAAVLAGHVVTRAQAGPLAGVRRQRHRLLGPIAGYLEGLSREGEVRGCLARLRLYMEHQLGTLQIHVAAQPDAEPGIAQVAAESLLGELRAAIGQLSQVLVIALVSALIGVHPHDQVQVSGAWRSVIGISPPRAVGVGGPVEHWQGVVAVAIPSARPLVEVLDERSSGSRRPGLRRASSQDAAGQNGNGKSAKTPPARLRTWRTTPLNESRSESVLRIFLKNTESAFTLVQCRARLSLPREPITIMYTLLNVCWLSALGCDIVRSMLHCLLRILPLALLACSTLFGQTAQVTGTVTDSSGAVVVLAKVVATNTATGVGRESTTNDRGNYLVTGLLPGRYEVTAEAAGFKQTKRGPVTLAIDQVARVDFALEVGGIVESVSVQATGVLLDAATSTIATVVENRQVTELPLSGRNPIALVALTPGVRIQGGFGGKGQWSNFSVNGGLANANTVLVEGLALDYAQMNAPAYVPPVDATQEFRIQTNNFSAEYGRSAGAVVNFSIKSGTNQLHGTAYNFLRNKSLDANNFFQNRAGNRRAALTQNQFGVSTST
ncbi:MAG: TonB-dependent receptor [Acidobacteria bacterium]|nr:TonB-dependent receptor [Acidobacteriota bacterium]